jgi:predicted DNA-binding transcriptional regulator AlpA
MPADVDTLVSAGTAAKMLGVSRNTIHDWEAAGRLPRSMRLIDGRPGGIRVWRESELREALSRTVNEKRSAASAA